MGRVPPGQHTSNGTVIRSTPDYARWFSEVSRKTHRSKQQIMEMLLYEYSEKHGHPAGTPPPRTYRFQ